MITPASYCQLARVLHTLVKSVIERERAIVRQSLITTVTVWLEIKERMECAEIPVDKILEFLHWFRLTISATSQYLSAIIYSDDPICCVYEEATVHNTHRKIRQKEKNYIFNVNK